jgi:hypothetical protein
MSCHLSINLMELVVALTTQLDFCHNCQKNENSQGRKCSTSVTTLTSEKLISTPDREIFLFCTALWIMRMPIGETALKKKRLLFYLYGGVEKNK